MHEIPVLIVGAGPVGLALAGDLGFQGAPCTLIEKTDGTVIQPKMDMVGIRTMEYCRRWGIVPWVESAGYNRAYPQDYAWVTSLNGYEFGREIFPAPRDEKSPPQSPQKRERCPQNFFDPVLRRFAQQWPGVSIKYRTELISLQEGPSWVESVIEDKETGERSVVRSQYVVGTDGGASRVREILNIGMSGEPNLTFTTNVIFRCENLEALHDKQPGYRYIFIGPEGTWATLVAIDGRNHWRFSLVGDQTRRALTETDLRAAIVRAMGKPFDFEIVSMMPWIRRQLVADRYGTQRVFLAGDAAHLTSPTGGFGMNTGIQDAVNLSWKLAASLKGWGGPSLLASYEVEQRPVAIRNVAEATDNLKRMLSPRLTAPPPEIFTDNSPAAQTARRAFGDHYTQMMKREWFTLGIHLGYVYEGSPIIEPDGTPRPPEEVSTYTPTARPGSRAPHIWLASGQSMLDYFGREFVLLYFGQAPGRVPELAAQAARRGIPFRCIDISSPEAAALYEKPLVLVRPDGQVAWRGDELPRDDNQLLDKITGANTDAPVEKRAAEHIEARPL
jgi:2-polyprenyl-6-methoxyphenol hydroxylase-like FAD-dependent oxidoreductase